ncbi:MAG: hypothetical protein HDT42_03755 [Ruminococcaceae bacterium]|nr:hypothetical protein [Oscillospiraceae bacterium]
MKFKGKKSIIAAALASIVAVGSFNTVALAEKTEHNVKLHSRIPNTPANEHVTRGGRINTNKAQVCEDEIVEITVEPYPGCQAKIILEYNGNKQTLASDITTQYTACFQMPDADVDVTAIWDYAPVPEPTPEPTPDPTPEPTPEQPPITPAPTWKKGDANCDGKVTAEDATAVLKHLAGITELSYMGSVNADMDQNGKVTAADATAILKLLVGKS